MIDYPSRYTSPLTDKVGQNVEKVSKPKAWLYEAEYLSGSYGDSYFEWRVTLNKSQAESARHVKPLYDHTKEWVDLTPQEEQLLISTHGCTKNQIRVIAEMLKEKNK